MDESDVSTSMLNLPDLVTESAPLFRGSGMLSGDLRFESMQYTVPVPANYDSKLNSAENWLGRFRLEAEPNLRYVLDLVAGQNMSMSTFHWGVVETYISDSNDLETKYAIGRKIADWSTADRDWHLGIWQPTYTQLDMLRPVDQGLTGFFRDVHSGEDQYLFFATPFFIPSMGPDVKDKNGSITSDSRWYQTPSNSFYFHSVITQISYSLEMPDAARLVMHPGAGVRYLHEEDKTLGYWWGASAGYKPMNSLLLRYNTILRVPVVGQSAEVTVTPEVGYHEVGGIDFGYRQKDNHYSVSLLADHPEPALPDGSWFQQQPEPFQSIGLHWAHTIDENFSSKVEYLRILGGKIHDVDASGTKVGALLDSRFLFTNALSAEIDTEAKIYHKKLSSSLRYMREFDQQGSMLNGEVRVYPAPQVYVSLGFDVLSVDNNQNVDTSFLNEFRGNDRYYGGFSYVF